MTEDFKERLKKGLLIRDMTAADLSRKTGISRSLISHYLSGDSEPRQTKLYAISVALNVTEPWLMGFDVPMERDTHRVGAIQTQAVPLIGSIACGIPTQANEEFEAYVQVGARIDCDFCLRANGDSMIGARINDGDIVFIRKQSLVNNGEIAAVIIDDQATLKRVYLEDNKLVLMAENPKYAPLIYVGEELNSIRILGKAVAFQSDVR